ncbi:MAG: hypothetical protein ACD_37C00163G0001 [uncultured bacterium]|nr:MAG: hypothetical protein ACD_37C00163G0001 [uncultured bacterium]
MRKRIKIKRKVTVIEISEVIFEERVKSDTLTMENLLKYLFFSFIVGLVILIIDRLFLP